MAICTARSDAIIPPRIALFSLSAKRVKMQTTTGSSIPTEAGKATAPGCVISVYNCGVCVCVYEEM